MKKETIIICVILFIVVFLGGVVLIKNNNEKKENNADNKNIEIENNTNNNNITDKENETNIVNNNENIPDNSDKSTTSQETQYTFTNEFGDNTKTISIKAKQIERASGFPGASSNVYYIQDDNLYHLELVNLTTQKIATNVESLTKKEENIEVKVKKNHEVLIEDMCIEYVNK